ncbi:MAG: hypothetical protein CVT49_13190 [candidate division Zixibacteria bacterium HGW-Zixibacteria-1]|nr:MAG: hypothetical protein CVT49_13190 [candidate division Zixibacteria bacterium HGW-Zixibacteria-1]
MGKRKEFNFVGHAHELTFTCFKNRPFLLSERACQNLVFSIIKAREKHSFDLWAYVFMPNHVHLLIYPNTKKYSIARILTSIKQPVSRKMVNYLKRYYPIGLQLMVTGQKKCSL